MHREKAGIAVLFEFITQHSFIFVEAVGGHPDNYLTHM